MDANNKLFGAGDGRRDHHADVIITEGTGSIAAVDDERRSVFPKYMLVYINKYFPPAECLRQVTS